MTSARNWPRVWRMTLAILLFNSGLLGAVAVVEPAQCAGSRTAVPQWNAAELGLFGI